MAGTLRCGSGYPCAASLLRCGSLATARLAGVLPQPVSYLPSDPAFSPGHNEINPPAAVRLRLWRALRLFLGLRLNAVHPRNNGSFRNRRILGMRHCRGVPQARDERAIFVDQHFSNAEAGWAVHLCRSTTTP